VNAVRLLASAVAAGLIAACAATSSAGPGYSEPAGIRSALVLNGHTVTVAWSDGDTFVFESGLRRGGKARLMGVNTLETYGPVHRWGDWASRELLEIARGSARVAAEAPPTCSTRGAKDRYGRLLVDCAGIREELLRTGHGHLYPFDREAKTEDVALQAAARRARVGMWRKGVPTAIVTKTEAATADNGWSAAHWLVSTDDGRSRRIGHGKEYAVCDEVCVGRPPAVPSCLRWVPWERRYTDRPGCLLDQASAGERPSE
jgi:endonuclease YncB( thermonuclease family)